MVVRQLLKLKLIPKNIPNTLIIGPPKSGTTFLFQILKSHPEICGSNIKETRYFSPLLKDNKIKRIDHYLKFFKHYNNEKIIMEATPGYFFGEKHFVKQIKDILGDLKIIIILREPVSRLFSSYKHKIRFNRLNEDESFLTFSKKDENFNKQLYHKYLIDWIEVFGEKSIKVVFFEDLINNTLLLSSDIFSWLKINNHDINIEDLKNTNKSIGIKSGLIHKIALIFFMKFRTVLPFNLRTKIRDIYFRLNGKSNNIFIKESEKIFLNNLFFESNSSTRQVLIENGYKNLPNWLNSKKIEY